MEAEPYGDFAVGQHLFERWPARREIPSASRQIGVKLVQESPERRCHLVEVGILDGF